MTTMNKPFRSTLCTEHRLARLAAWARLMLAWIAMLLFADDTPRPNRRHIKRYGVSLDSMARMVRNLMIIRAAQLTRPNLRTRRQCPNYAPRGFAKRMRPRHAPRSVAGSRLRRALRRGDAGGRIALLLDLLANLDAAVAKFMPKPRRTRLSPLIVTGPAPDAVRSLAAPIAFATDSS